MLPIRANPKQKRSLEKRKQPAKWKLKATPYKLNNTKKHTATSLQQPKKKQKKEKEYKIDQDYS